MEINQYTNTATTLNDNTLFDIDFYIGVGNYQTQKMPFSVLKDNMPNFANSNLTLNADHVHSFDGNILAFNDIKRFVNYANTAPSSGVASYETQGYGTLFSDVTHLLSSQNGKTLELYGDNSSRIFGLLGVNGEAPSAGYGVISSGSTAGVRGQGYYGVMGVNTIAGGSGGYFQSSNKRSIYCDGDMFFNNFTIGESGKAVGDTYFDTASNILANGDLILAIKQ